MILFICDVLGKYVNTVPVHSLVNVTKCTTNRIWNYQVDRRFRQTLQPMEVVLGYSATSKGKDPSSFVKQLLYTLGHKYGNLTFSESKLPLRRLACKNSELECQKSFCKSHYFTSSYKSVQLKIFVRWLVL